LLEELTLSIGGAAGFLCAKRKGCADSGRAGPVDGEGARFLQATTGVSDRMGCSLSAQEGVLSSKEREIGLESDKKKRRLLAAKGRARDPPHVRIVPHFVRKITYSGWGWKCPVGGKKN